VDGDATRGEWSLVYDELDLTQEGLRETLCTLGNGYFATRGAAPESSADGIHYPGTYVAGCYNRRKTGISGRTVENESIVNLPNWLPLTFRVNDGPWFDLQTWEVLSYRQELDLQRGTLIRAAVVRDSTDQVTRMTQRRFVSMADPHLAGLETTLVAENWSGRVVVRSGLDGRIVNAGVARYLQFNDDHLVGVDVATVGDETVSIVAETSQSHIRVAEAARTRVSMADGVASVVRRVVGEPRYVAHELAIDLEREQSVTIEKIVSLYTSRDRAISEGGLEAASWVSRAGGFDELLERHVVDWRHLWGRFSLAGEGDESPSLVLRLHVFHLLQTVSRNTLDLDVSVPARGLHGEAYRGHIFWDEVFVFPYLTFHLPELTRSLLLYRCRRLPEARWAAREAGYSGAMYPWQSGSDGREESQVVHLNPRSGRWLIDASRLQRHINSAIAYNIWGYYQTTGDTDFLATYGAEVLLEIARFWARIATHDRSSDRYDILRVMGPDEYHDAYPDAAEPGLDNNAYTNVMAVWVLRRAVDVLGLLPEPRRGELREALDLRAAELSRWEEIIRKMRVVFHGDGMISQFEGYEDLKELDWEAYRARYGDISRLDRILEAEGDTTNAYKVSKQADLLMLFYLLSADELSEIFAGLGYTFDPDTIPKTVDYYLARTSHGSTLSRVVHSWVLARSDREQSWQFFRDCLFSDLHDIQRGTAAEGIHLGAMAGTLDLVQRCYTGIDPRDDVLWLNPLLPTEVRELRFDLRYRRRWLGLRITSDAVEVSHRRERPGAVKVGLRYEVIEIEPGESVRLEL
jgi:alpha,alpha-trehalase